MNAKPGITILLVEDDEIQLKVLEAILSQAGYAYVSAKDGFSALDKLNQETFNLVISDINMPGGISGFNLVRTVRGIERLSLMPFIFVTGRNDKRDIDRAINSGINDYIIKPVDRDILLAKIESLIAKNEKLFAFSEQPIQCAGTLQLKFEIDGISEQAIKFLSPIALPINFKMKIDASIFQEIDIDPPQMRVSSSEMVKSLNHMHRIHANFIGLSNKEMNAIRRWLMQSKIRKAQG